MIDATSLRTAPALVAGVGLIAALGCRPQQPTNQDLLTEYSGERYQQDLVATEYATVEDQGEAIDPRTQAAIDDTIRTVYVADFAECLEKEMDRLENRWVAGTFSVEFTIEPTGMVSSVELLGQDIKERRTPNDKGEYVSEGGAAAREAEQFGDCIETYIYKWEFDPPPEVTYSHTYNGEVGEAW